MDEHGPFRGQYTKCHLSVIWDSWDSNKSTRVIRRAAAVTPASNSRAPAGHTPAVEKFQTWPWHRYANSQGIHAAINGLV